MNYQELRHGSPLLRGTPDDWFLNACFIYLRLLNMGKFYPELGGGTGGVFEDLNLVSKLQSINRLPLAIQHVD